MLDDALLAKFIDGFYGYGSYQSPVWFIGMEEGGGNSMAEIERRLTLWKTRGHRETEDLALYHEALGMGEYFREPVKNQATWNKLIRIALSAANQPVTLETVKAYQQKRFGRLDGEACLLELLPLPSPGTGHWLYGEQSNLPALTDRAAYREHYAPLRVKQIRQRVLMYQPQTVVFYSSSAWYRAWWQKIAGVEFETRSADGMSYYTAGTRPLFVVTAHPTAQGVTLDYFHQIGEYIRQVTH